MTATTEKSEDETDFSIPNDVGSETAGMMALGYDDQQNDGNDFTRENSSGALTGKDKDSDGRAGNRKDRPLAVTCTHCRSRKISMFITLPLHEPYTNRTFPLAECDNGKPSCNNCVK